jgi:hypothetical protein
MYPYVKNCAVYLCPADYGTTLVGTTRCPQVRSYSMNLWVGTPTSIIQSLFSTQPAYHLFLKETDVGNMGPANLMLVMDENSYSINDGMFVNLPSSGNWGDCPGSYHGNAGGINFADGHGEIHHWSDQAVLIPNSTHGWQYMNTPPQQQPATDLQWLYSHSTVHY